MIVEATDQLPYLTDQLSYLTDQLPYLNDQLPYFKIFDMLIILEHFSVNANFFCREKTKPVFY